MTIVAIWCYSPTEDMRREIPFESVKWKHKYFMNVLEFIDLKGSSIFAFSEGYYATRTEFIKTAIKKQIDKHDSDTKQLLEQRVNYGYQFSVGVGGFTKSELEKIIQKKEKKVKIVFVGLFVLSKDITLELLEQTVETIKVYGVCRCSQEIKDKYGL